MRGKLHHPIETKHRSHEYPKRVGTKKKNQLSWLHHRPHFQTWANDAFPA